MAKKKSKRSKKKSVEKKLEKEFDDAAIVKKPEITKSTKNLIYLVVGILVLLGIILLLRNYIPDDADDYNGFHITKGSDDLWHVELTIENTEYDIPLHYHPTELEDIVVWGDPNWFFRLLTTYGLNAAYLTFNPIQPQEGLKYVALASAEISLTMGQVFNVKPIAACLVNETSACDDRPIVDCSSDDRMVIYIKENFNNRTSITEDTNCITVEGQGVDVLRAAEKLIYYWLGVVR